MVSFAGRTMREASPTRPVTKRTETACMRMAARKIASALRAGATMRWAVCPRRAVRSRQEVFAACAESLIVRGSALVSDLSTPVGAAALYRTTMVKPVAVMA